MKDGLTIRVADPDTDAEAVAAIYAPYVAETVISFEAEPPSAEVMRERIAATLAWTPWLVAEVEGVVVGYAYASRHATRAAYRWSVDLSVYLATNWQGKGLGRRLYDRLIPILQAQGFVNAYAGVGEPNPASIALHRIGMTRVGTYRQVGFKHGAWHDVTWFEMRIAPLPAEPAEPIAFPEWLART